MPRLTFDATTVLAKALRLPLPAQRVSIVRVRNIAVPNHDGGVLLTDTWYPQGLPEAPVILIRTPYGRRETEAFLGGYLARHGFRAMVQSCRGTFDSTGPFVPFATDADDALATVEWLREQPWFAGKLATYGVSFAGYTAWAMAKNPPPELVAVVPVVAPLNPRSTLFPDGTMSAEVLLTWSRLMPEMPTRTKALLFQRALKRDVEAAARAMPPMGKYSLATKGARKGFVESWFEHDADDAFWQDVDLSNVPQSITVPTLLVGAWHDLFTADTVEQFVTLHERGVDTALVVAATTHSGYARALPVVFSHVLPWLRDAFAGRRPAAAGSVIVQEVGTGTWHTLPSWPPPAATTTLFLQHDATLAPLEPPFGAGSHSFRYDPNDPTPSIGGELLSLNAKADNRPLEQRSDVLTFTTEALQADLLLGGTSTVTLWWECDGASYDVFVRLLDVAPDGRSTTITDRIRRFLTSEPGVPEQVEIVLPPTYSRVPAGHRLRLLITAGAHPRYLRNHGTADPFGKADTVIATHNRVHHNAAQPSAVTLPVR